MVRWFIHYFDQKERKWKKIYRMCLTSTEAYYNMSLLERADKLEGKCTIFRVLAITIKPTSKKQLELTF